MSDTSYAPDAAAFPPGSIGGFHQEMSLIPGAEGGEAPYDYAGGILDETVKGGIEGAVIGGIVGVSAIVLSGGTLGVAVLAGAIIEGALDGAAQAEIKEIILGGAEQAGLLTKEQKEIADLAVGVADFVWGAGKAAWKYSDKLYDAERAVERALRSQAKRAAQKIEKATKKLEEVQKEAVKEAEKEALDLANDLRKEVAKQIKGKSVPIVPGTAATNGGSAGKASTSGEGSGKGKSQPSDQQSSSQGSSGSGGQGSGSSSPAGSTVKEVEEPPTPSDKVDSIPPNAVDDGRGNFDDGKYVYKRDPDTGEIRRYSAAPAPPPRPGESATPVGADLPDVRSPDGKPVGFELVPDGQVPKQLYVPPEDLTPDGKPIVRVNGGDQVAYGPDGTGYVVHNGRWYKVKPG